MNAFGCIEGGNCLTDCAVSFQERLYTVELVTWPVSVGTVGRLSHGQPLTSFAKRQNVLYSGCWL